jgi:hypothetical protein
MGSTCLGMVGQREGDIRKTQGHDSGVFTISNMSQLFQLFLSFIHAIMATKSPSDSQNNTNQRFGTSYVIAFMIVLNEMVKHIHSVTCELKLHTLPMQENIFLTQIFFYGCNPSQSRELPTTLNDCNTLSSFMQSL